MGSAFGAIFPEAGVEASKKVDLMQDIHRQYYERLRPAIGTDATVEATATTSMSTGTTP